MKTVQKPKGDWANAVARSVVKGRKDMASLPRAIARVLREAYHRGQQAPFDYNRGYDDGFSDGMNSEGL